MSSIYIFFVCALTSQVLAWEALPSIPTGRRSQFLVLQDDGAYKFGYDTGNGNAAKQEADASNQVQGHYFYKNSAGQDIDLKYTSGVQGFQPEGLEKLQKLIGASAPSGSYQPTAQSYSSPNDDDSGAYHPDNSGDYNSGANSDDSGTYNPDNTGEYNADNSGDYKGDQGPSGDASYNFNVDTPSYKRTESSDHGGNIHGSYSYSNKQGTHDLQYKAGAGTGFIARSGSLSKPNGLGGGGGAGAGYEASSGGYYSAPGGNAAPKGLLNPDGSYSFGYSTNDQSREESGDASGNVRGRFSFKNSAGNHDLSYKAGAETGFLVTSGSLAKPNGLPIGAGVGSPSRYSAPSSPSAGFKSSSSASDDGSYSFGFATDDQDRQEDSDASGNVRGHFSYKNSAGNHDLSYVAGSATGFQPTGGSLSNPNGLGGRSAPASSASGYSSPAGYSGATSGDGSYNFNFDTGDYQRKESSDASGKVRGSYSYHNSAGNHDLSFEAGAGIGFKPTGGSLNTAPGLSETQLRAGFRGSARGGAESYSAPTGASSQSESSYRLGNVKVHTYLPPSNEKRKYGYIFETKY